MTTINFKLEREAKKQGGDRYTGNVDGEERPMVVYIPQTISRPDGDPIKTLAITFDVPVSKLKKKTTTKKKKKKKK